MKKIIFLMLLSMLFQGCKHQNQKTAETEPLTEAIDTIKPQVSLRVNKKYDDKGNLVQYDSTYSYFYSSPGGTQQQLNSDSFYTQFESMLHKEYDDWLSRGFNSIFFSDSLFKYDFLNKDYFDKRFELNEPMFHDLFKEMDSLKTDLLNRHYPDGTMQRKK